ncbi:hypothetical protein [Falsirhodobacter sp. alg1]|uniref:hypothetical protein n=1 Tax=Falsirhodobacter sp. alg1 TaxID=1472418 RepID=UPI0005EDE357|nr:hypothetical protein [Falsirhodobacter sp. alg1]
MSDDDAIRRATLSAVLCVILAYGLTIMVSGIGLMRLGAMPDEALLGLGYVLAAALLLWGRTIGFWVLTGTVAAAVVLAILQGGGGLARYYALRGPFVACVGLATLGYTLPSRVAVSRRSFFAVTLGAPFIMATVIAATI